MIGCLALAMRCAAFWSAASEMGAAWAPVEEVEEWARLREGRDRSASSGWRYLAGMAWRRIPAVTSLGRSTRTGPGRPEVAILNASLIRRGSSAMSLTMTFHLVQLREMPTISASWNASDPIALVAT